MSFGAFESSRYKGSPTNLYLIEYGSQPGSTYAYTDSETAIVNEGVTYQPLPVSRGKIAVSGTLDKATLEVRMSVEAEVAELFRVYPPSQVVNITVFQGHLDDPDGQFLVGWMGRIISAKRTDTELILTCEPVSTSMKRLGLRRHYQYSCMHVLFGEWCRASKAAATTEVVIEGINKSDIVLPVGWTTDDMAPKHTNGMVEWTDREGNTQFRTILRVTDNRVLLMSGALTDLQAGASVKVIRGCNHTLEDCALHNSLPNFGGCPWIPQKNPTGFHNQFY